MDNSGIMQMIKINSSNRKKIKYINKRNWKCYQITKKERAQDQLVSNSQGKIILILQKLLSNTT